MHYVFLNCIIIKAGDDSVPTYTMWLYKGFGVKIVIFPFCYCINYVSIYAYESLITTRIMQLVGSQACIQESDQF